MQAFIAAHQQQISSVLSGFDRLVFHGTLRSIAHSQGMHQYLASNGVLLKDFGARVHDVSQRLKTASLAEAVATHRPVCYLASSALGKEDITCRIASEDNITHGLVCVLTCVEPCRTFEIYRNRHTWDLQLQPRVRKCLFLYHYAVHPVFGYLNARIQTWFPSSVQICLSGREWLAQQMDAARLAYRRHDNCFPWIEDWQQAQQLMDQQLVADWPSLPSSIAVALNPIHDQLFKAHPTTYYWSTYPSEWAIDMRRVLSEPALRPSRSTAGPYADWLGSPSRLRGFCARQALLKRSWRRAISRVSRTQQDRSSAHLGAHLSIDQAQPVEWRPTAQIVQVAAELCHSCQVIPEVRPIVSGLQIVVTYLYEVIAEFIAPDPDDGPTLVDRSAAVRLATAYCAQNAIDAVDLVFAGGTSV